MTEIEPGPALSVGIDVAEETKGLDLVALDPDRDVVDSIGGLSVLAASERVLELAPTVVCIDSPSGWSHSGASRQAERDLRRMGISSFATPQDPGDHPFYRWMRVGFALFAALADHYERYRGGDVVGTCTEVFPSATAIILDGRLRPPQETKVRFRRRVLREHGVDEARLANVDRVDAGLAALTGVLGVAGDASWVGDPDEGVVLLPGPRPRPIAS